MRYKAPETSLPSSIPLSWSLPLTVQAGDGARLVRLFGRAWDRLPATAQRTLLLGWINAGAHRVQILLAQDLTGNGFGPNAWGACRPDGLVLAFRSDVLAYLPDDLAMAMIAHEIMHAVFALDGCRATEADVDRAVEGIGLPMARLRQLAMETVRR